MSGAGAWLETWCPQCGQALKVPNSAAGRRGRCVRCKHEFVIGQTAPPDGLQGLPVDDWIRPTLSSSAPAPLPSVSLDSGTTASRPGSAAASAGDGSNSSGAGSWLDDLPPPTFPAPNFGPSGYSPPAPGYPAAGYPAVPHTPPGAYYPPQFPGAMGAVSSSASSPQASVAQHYLQRVAADQQRQQEYEKAAEHAEAGPFGLEMRLMNSGVIGGIAIMVVSVVWFFGALAAGYFFFYPPLLFLVGIATFIKGLVDRKAV